MDKRTFTTSELNEMMVEATLGATKTSIKGPGAQEQFERIRSQVNAMKSKGYMPEPAKD